MKIASLIVVTFFAAASVMSAAAEPAPFIKKPKALGAKVNTVTMFKSGPHIFCQGRCSDGVPFSHWECQGSIVDTMCALVCRPIPRGECRHF